MPETAVEKTRLKPVILEVLNDLFNISDIEEAKRTPVGRLISLEVRLEALATEVRRLESSLRAEMKALESEMKAFESSLRAEMKALEKTVDAKLDLLGGRLDQLGAKVAWQEKLLYIILTTMVAGFIKVIFFP